MQGYSNKLIRFWATLLSCFFFWLVFGPIGLLFGLFFGKLLTSSWFKFIDSQHRIQSFYFEALFLVLGHMCKVDGHISKEEIRVVENLFRQMELTPHGRKMAIEYFTRGQKGKFNLEKTLAKLKHYCESQKGLLRLFLQAQFEAARLDGITAEQQTLLDHICTQLGFSPKYYYQQNSSKSEYKYEEQASDSAKSGLHNHEICDYALLEVDSNVNKSELKTAYRRLMSQHHPDKMIAKGLPESMIKIATRKTQDIQSAYKRIKLAKGF